VSSTPAIEQLAPHPFREWCEARLKPAVHEHEIGAKADRFTGPVALAEALEVDERTLRHWRVESETIPRHKLEDALLRVGVAIWDLYPELAEEEAGRHRWCPSCEEVVPTTPEKHCLWCDRSCYFEVKPDNAAPLRKLSDDHLRSLHRIYAEGGLTLLGLARRIYKQAGYASERSARNSLGRGFRRLGLQTFPQQARTGLSFCEERVKFGARKGQPCGLPKMLGATTCLHHKEDDGERARHLAELRSRRFKPKAMAA